MIAVDTNILIYAHRRDSPWYKPAAKLIKSLAEGRATWAIAWPCLHEFISIATNKRIYQPSSTLDEALAQVDIWMQSPQLNLLSEQSSYWAELKALARAGQVNGGQIHDTRIAALCLHHGVSELWTADRDFSRYPKLRTRNPLVS